MKKITLLLAVLFITGSVLSCSSESDNGRDTGNGGNEEGVWEPAEPVIPSLTGLNLNELSGYPEGLNVYSFADTRNSIPTLGYIAICDMNEGTPFRFTPYYVYPVTTPSGAFTRLRDSEDKGEPLIVTNGGYFARNNTTGETVSISMLILNGLKYCDEQGVYGGSVDGNSTTNVVNTWPVRGNFGEMPDGSFEVQWIYCLKGDEDWTPKLRKPYAFPDMLGNDESTGTYNPSPPPTGEEEGAYHWQPKNSIGGGPMLLRNGENVAVECYWGEVFHAGGIGGLTRQPRTCIGITEDKQLLLFVCDGRTSASAGYTLEEMADLLKEFGVVNAINLDGGGSTAMVGKDGTVLNSPSDGSERSVPTVVAITKK